LKNPAHYVTSEYYRPGFIAEIGFLAAAILLVLLIFIGTIIGARYVLLTSRRLSGRQRRILKLIAGLGAPRRLEDRGERRLHEEGKRRKTEPHYKMKSAPAGEGAASAALATTSPERVERPAGRSRLVDLKMQPEERWPFYGEDEIDAVANVLRSGKVNQWTGDRVFALEQAYTRALRNGRSIALANGSVALELALRALGIKPGDEVIVTPRSFVASAFCVRLVGATPVFADVDRDSGAMTAAAIAAAIGPRTRAVIPVHLGGWPADMPAIMAVAREHNLLVIEDCAQAHGAEIDGLPVGSFGDAATFSFCQDKIITTAGEGGLLNVRGDNAFERAWSFKDHGKNRKRALQQPSEPGFRWLHDSVGTNWRMTEIAAAIGLLQLDKLPSWRARRAANAQTWADALDGIDGIRVPRLPRNLTGAWYKFYAHVDVDSLENRELRDRILKEAAEAGVRVFSGSCSEIYREAAFADMKVEPLPIASELAESSLMLEVHPTLDARRQRDRADALAEIARGILR
jgi:dTDP-4-amino-4,6-dideoxygalactose transaminase